MFKSNLKNEVETARVGKRWYQDEDEQLLTEIENNKTYEEIALEHKRTVNGIKCHVVSIIIYPLYKNENKSIDDLSLKYNIEREVIQKYIDKINMAETVKKSITKNKQEVIIKETNNINKSVKNSSMKVIFEKIISLEHKMLLMEEKLNKMI